MGASSSFAKTGAFGIFITRKDQVNVLNYTYLILLTLSRRNHAVPQPLDTSDNERAGFYVNAAMDNSLNLLYIWSSGGGYHYLHWWRIETVDQKVRLVQHHEKQFPAVSGSPFCNITELT